MTWYQTSISEIARNHREAVGATQQEALTYAFNQKYGDYDYRADIRAHYPNWAHDIRMMTDVFGPPCVQSILDVGSNTGQELNEIFSPQLLSTASITCADLADRALNKTTDFLHNATVIQADMCCVPLPTHSQDIYLNLRAIQSSGVDITATVQEADRLTAKQGLAVFSIANGYLDETGREVRGLYKKGNFTTDAVMKQAFKVAGLLYESNFSKSIIIEQPTEMFVFGIR